MLVDIIIVVIMIIIFFYLLLAMSPWVWHSPHLADNIDTVSRGPGLIKELVF